MYWLLLLIDLFYIAQMVRGIVQHGFKDVIVFGLIGFLFIGYFIVSGIVEDRRRRRG